MNRKMIYRKTDAALEIAGYICYVAAFLTAAYACVSGVRIPEKFDAAGNVIKYGSPGILFLMPAILLPCNLLFSLALHLIRPEVWNVSLPFAIRPVRIIVVYRDMVRMQTVLELLIGIFTVAFTFFLYLGMKEAVIPLAILFILGIAADIAGMIAVAARHNKQG